MLIRLARITVSAVVSAVAIAWLLASCEFGDNTIGVDALGGHSDEVQACCRCLVDPRCSVQGCLDETACEIGDGLPHWLTCDLVVTSLHYHSEACP